MQVGFMMQKALGELFILKSTKPLPIIFKGRDFHVGRELLMGRRIFHTGANYYSGRDFFCTKTFHGADFCR